MSDFNKVISKDEVTSHLNGAIVMAKLMDYKVRYGKGTHGPVIILRKNDKDYFKLKIINQGKYTDKYGIHLAITIHALQSHELFERYKKVKHHFKPNREDPSTVIRKGNDSTDSCTELIDNLSFLL